ncbi:hypothetical protein NDU88_004770, partial [Pleurodeles waltl]
ASLLERQQPRNNKCQCNTRLKGRDRCQQGTRGGCNKQTKNKIPTLPHEVPRTEPPGHGATKIQGKWNPVTPPVNNRIAGRETGVPRTKKRDTKTSAYAKKEKRGTRTEKGKGPSRPRKQNHGRACDRKLPTTGSCPK